MRRSIALAASLAALAASPVALAGSTGWDWDEDRVYDWTPAALLHAQAIVEGEPSLQDIMENQPAPLLEPWCIIEDAVEPEPEDCGNHANFIDGWHHALLGLEPEAELPPELPSWQHSCESICSQ
jgi:hypothetical protein